MRYHADSRMISIDAPELVRLARRRSDAVFRDEENEQTFRRTSPHLSTLTATVERNGRIWEVTSTAEIGEESVTIPVLVDGDPARPAPETVRQARGEGFCAAYLLSLTREIERPEMILRYSGRGTSSPVELRERPTQHALRTFFEKLLDAPEAYCEAELDRVCRRLPTMASVPFPFPSVRPEQRELISACYRAIRDGGRLYASAPTGTGKTVSVLFPAVRALGDGFCEKIFYLTPKNTTARAAADTACRLAAAGADLRALRLTAKEAICPRGLLCRKPGGERCPLSRLAPAREDEAARDLLASGKTVIDAEELCRMGEERKLCPYELSLRYAMLSDLVICDYNYLFDLRVFLHRFFSVPGDWCFLIDEAHNLVDRSRELYSATLPLTFLDRFRPFTVQNPSFSDCLNRTVSSLRAILSPLVADTLQPDTRGVVQGFCRTEELPPGLPEALTDCAEAAEELLAERKLPLPALSDLQSAVFDLRDIITRLSLYSEKFISFVSQTGDSLTYRSLCLDPSEVLASRLALGKSAVLFSATLTPTDYYKTVLGGDRTSDTLDLPSPFDPSRLCVAVLDRIGTRYSEREDSLRTVARAILTAVRAKPGNYLVFCPSFAYLEALSGMIAKLAPKLPTVRQERHMDGPARAAFLDRFSEDNRSALVGFSVLGGIFAEGIDLVGRRLIGSVVIGVGLPLPTPEREAIRAYYDEAVEAGREYAYVFPGMNRVLQAAGRVIRREDDRGVILLIDDRFSEPVYRELIPAHWRGLKYAGTLDALTVLLDRFWNRKSTD